MSIGNLTAFAGVGKAWHGFGSVEKQNFSIEEAMIKGDCAFEVEKRPLFIRGSNEGFVCVDGKFANVRTDLDLTLGLSSDRYEVIQNREAWDIFEPLVEETNASVETVGCFDQGRQVFTLVKTPEVSEIVKDDPIEKYFLIVNSFDGSKPLYLQYTNVRVVCANTLQAALKGANHQIKIRHTTNAQENIELSKKILSKGKIYWDKFASHLLSFSKKTVNTKMAQEFVENLFPVSAKSSKNKIPTRTQNMREMVLRAFEESPGNQLAGKTVYGLYNAATWFNDHQRSLRTGGFVTPADRFKSTMVGSGEKLRDEAFRISVQLTY